MSTRTSCPANPNITSTWEGTLALGAVLSSGTVMVLVLARVFGKLAHQSTDYPMFHVAPLAYGLGGFLCPIVLFGAIDGVASHAAWNWLGKVKEDPLIAAGCYVFSRASFPDTRARVACYLLGCSMIILGLVSYAWWGSFRHWAWRVDNVMMEVQTMGLAVVFLAISFPTIELQFVFCWMALACIRFWLLRKGADLVIPSCFAVCSAIFAMYCTGGRGNLGLFTMALGLSLCGFAPKIADIQGLWLYGTSLFHYMEGFAFATFFLWAETLPASYS